MATSLIDPSRAPVALGRRAVPQLFEELQQRPEVVRRQCVYQAVHGGPPLLLPPAPLSQLLDDLSSSCRRSVHRVLKRLTSPAGADALLTLVPKLMLKLRQEKEEEEVQALILSTLSSCSYHDPRPALVNDGVSLLGHILSHLSTNIRREAADALMAMIQSARLSVDEDLEVQVNAVGVIMFTVTITTGKQQCLDLDVLSLRRTRTSEGAPRAPSTSSPGLHERYKKIKEFTFISGIFIVSDFHDPQRINPDAAGAERRRHLRRLRQEAERGTVSF
ncbi:Radial spoke head 14-like protein [Larimichthys crocea]|uniref:Radial spoke head 14-like protein n=1 Tax=Larimichthys crocea TaxID=215358 RepID=A0A6G0I7K7_LARCR|nr:Radial spoke head 14-like protein [Larimichthys crocea]